MKKYGSLLLFLLLLLAVYLSFTTAMPGYDPDRIVPATEFSTTRALVHVKEVSKEVHAVGFPAHKTVRDYLVKELEKLGLEVTIQRGYTAGDWGNYTRAINVLARIKGTASGKALLLLSHYDSNPHSSFGASDDGAGLATILESLRAYLAQDTKPKNDIIILFSDAEELGLNGADLFVNQHPWTKDVGLVLNFEARGSGGPSFLLMETNRGNQRLVEELVAADLDYPYGHSLAYSIYKLLPNDTDLTVFREDADIEGYNFAFIDDHYDYHTARDTYERLNPESLAHQGSYLLPLLRHFSERDLSDLKSLNDMVYLNIPFYGLVKYPFDWIRPMLFLASLIFLIFLYWGFKKKKLRLGPVLKGFAPALAALVINGVLGLYGWQLLKTVYPSYKDMLHGFTYNGYEYIAAFVLISLAVCFGLYHRYRRIETASLLVAPLVLWLLICLSVAVYLPGASFFIIPVFALLAAFYIWLNDENPNRFFLVFLCVPALWIYPPLIKSFPVALGLNILVAATALISLTFLLLLPVLGGFKNKGRWGSLMLLLGFGFLIAAHLKSGYNADQAKPTSLLYVVNADNGQAYWATYEREIDPWTAQYFQEERMSPEDAGFKTLSSKYSTGWSTVARAENKAIPAPAVSILRDTIRDGVRDLEILITHNRPVNRLEVFTNELSFESASINEVPLNTYFLNSRKGGRLLTHYVSDNEASSLSLRFDPSEKLELTLYEASNDLLHHPQFSIPARPGDQIPTPFVLNDAVLLIKSLEFE